MEIDLSFEHLIAALNRSLKRLGTSYVDLFQAHKPPRNEKEIHELIKAFDYMKKQGLARYCGISIGRNYKVGLKLAKDGIIDTLQLYFSLIDYEPIKKLFPIARKKRIGIIVAEPLSQGFLTGKYKPNHVFSSDDVRSGYEKKLLQRKLKWANEYRFLEAKDRTMSQAAIAYVLNRQEVSVCVPSAKTVNQLKENIKASNITIKSNEMEIIKNIQHKFSG